MNNNTLMFLVDGVANAENPHGANFRRLPPGVPVHRYLSGLYRRYPVSQVGLPKEVLSEVPDLDTGYVVIITAKRLPTPLLIYTLQHARRVALINLN
jgi:hypothetical protein